MTQNDWIKDMHKKTVFFLSEIEQLQLLNDAQLNHRLAKDSWSILECVEHLNRYGAYYIPALRSGLQNSKPISQKNFKSGWLGSYFAKSMTPKERLNKMKTFKDKDPIHSTLDRAVVATCLKQQQELLELLKLAENRSLQGIRIATTLGKWIRMNAGDTFHFVIQHNLRHLQQIKRLRNEHVS